MIDLQKIRDRLRAIIGNWFERPMVAVFSAIGVGPNVATLLGVAIAGVGAYFASQGDFMIAGILVLAGSAFDLIDGGLARKAGVVSDRGALLDSVLDRVSESLIFLGLIFYYTDPDTMNQANGILTLIALTGSLMISYVRARAEGLGLRGKAGFMTRPERVAIISVLLIFSQPTAMLWILAAGAPLSATARFISVWRLAGGDSGTRD